ncbi:MAG: hypothetical protein H0X24_03865 [Ktedonobacterales bacterium]|nr:hypothetical protein [Ktedonobacterales bacterium]
MPFTQRLIYWLGGSPCAGKSTVAQIIAARQGWDIYACDAAYQRHVDAADPRSAPLLFTVGHLRDDALWLRPVAEQTATAIGMYCEEFAAILADVATRPGTEPLLVEGAALLPELVAPLLGTHHRAAWLVPTPAFQRHHYAQRDWARALVATCSDPPQAFANWMARDIGFAAYVTRTAQTCQVPLHSVDGSAPVSDSVAWVLAQWGIT